MPLSRWPRLLGLTFALLAAGLSLPASAQEVDPAAANLKAIDLSRAGAYEEAIEIWITLLQRQGDQYEHAPVLYRNIGRNYQKLERYPQAWWYLRRAVEMGTADREKPALWLFQVEKSLKEAGLIQVRLVAAEAGARIVLDEGERLRIYAAPLDWWFPAGPRSVTLKTAAGELVPCPIDVSTTRTRFVLPPGADDPIEKPADPGHGKPSAWRRVRPLSWSLLGSGAALLAGGGVTWFFAERNLEQLDSDIREKYGDEPLPAAFHDQARAEWDDRIGSEVAPLEWTSYALWGLGAGTLTAGVVLAIMDTRDENDPPGSTLLFVPTSGGGTAAWSWVF
jgi:hypothetical protein